MTPDRFNYCLTTLRLSQRDLAAMVGCSTRLPQSWAAGGQTIPDAIADWLERCVAIRKAFAYPKPPKSWRRRAIPQPAEQETSL